MAVLSHDSTDPGRRLVGRGWSGITRSTDGYAATNLGGIVNRKNMIALKTRLEQLLDSPESAQFNMRVFGEVYDPSGIDVLKDYPPVCNTQACLAGETVLALGVARISTFGGIILDGEDVRRSYGSHIQSKATELLGLTDLQRKKLFYFKAWTACDGNGNGWPEYFENAYTAAKTPQGRLYWAIRRVEHFLKTNGRE